MNQLERCLRAPYTDFNGHELKESEFSLSWSQLFSKDRLSRKSLDFPLDLAPCQVLPIREWSTGACECCILIQSMRVIFSPTRFLPAAGHHLGANPGSRLTGEGGEAGKGYAARQSNRQPVALQMQVMSLPAQWLVPLGLTRILSG